MAEYTYRFEYECGIDDEGGDFISDPPLIFIVCPDGSDIIEVLLDPIKTVEKPDADDDHWKVPLFVDQLLVKLNKE